MCGVIGVFQNQDDYSKVRSGLSLLRNRGKDGCGIATEKEIIISKDQKYFPNKKQRNVLGHTLHAVVDNVSQPIKKFGILTANCEIYNWQALRKKYDLSGKNDAEVLLEFLDRFGLDKIEELDGVYAFAFWKNGKVILVRDPLGEKPLWYSFNREGFAFASEKKVLEKIGFVDINELNPRTILIYNLKNKSISAQNRGFFEYLPEHDDKYQDLKEHTSLLLDLAIQKRIPTKKFGLLFSGGVDSTYIAKYLKDNNYDFTCYTAALETGAEEPSDFIYAKRVSEKLGLKLKIKTVKISALEKYLKKVVPLIEDSNVVKVGVALTFYLACELAKKDGCKVIFSGLGSEEIFAGYERHKNSANINQECLSGLRKMYERDLYRDDVVTMSNNLELRLPFLDKELVDYALKIPERYKIKDDIGKYILREIALEKGLPEEFSFRKKTAAQYGSKMDYALGKLAKKHKFISKSAYLKKFYPSHNLKLGVLFSSGKDSLSAAYIMKQQNYELTCLITIRSENQESYMFQTAGLEMVKLQARAMGLPLLIQKTLGEKENELLDMEKALKKAQKKFRIQGIVSGALFSTYQRDRIEKICDKLGLKIFSPLWHKSQEQHLEEILQRNFQVVFSAVAADGLDESWLGREINQQSIADLKKLRLHNLAGEGGEFESLVLDCPLFAKRIELLRFRKIMDGKYSGRLIIEKARLVEKKKEL